MWLCKGCVGVSTILMLLLFSSFNFKSWVSIIALSHSILVGLKQREKFMPVIRKSLFLWNIENVICMWIFSDFVSSLSWLLTLDIGGNKLSDLQRMYAFHYFLSMQDILLLLVLHEFSFTNRIMGGRIVYLIAICLNDLIIGL